MQNTRFINGTIKRHPDGFGFFIPEDPQHPDVYIPRNSMEGIMTNDKVSIEVFPEKGSDRFRGEITRVLSRGTKTVVGRFYKMNDKVGLIRDEGKGWGQDLKIKIEDSMNAKDRELVAAEITQYPDKGKTFAGKVTEVLGDALDPLTDIKRVIHSNNIPVDFSKATINEAAQFSENPTEKDFEGRKDIRHLNLVTIDGATAKDFDDAVYVEMENRGFRLYVAIADVSHYVKVGGAIDKDAYERGTSVYFPNYVVPMLPEALSNGLCSLNPHVPRLCMVSEILIDFTGEPIESDFYEAVMESKSRVTYGEAQEIIDGNEVPKHAHVKEHILRLSDLAKILMAKRFKEGSLDLEIPETELVIDGAGVPVDIQRSERLFAHRLIEEMMLAANVAVATFLHSRNIPAIYRIHEPPNEMAIKMLEKYLENFGGKTKLASGKLQKRLTKALEEFKGKPESQVLNILTLRSMSQAKYSPQSLGHFGLGFEFYTHFTSPIRRYPDLIVHRLLKKQVDPSSEYRLMSEDDLASAGTVLSAAEQRSVKAERQVQAIKKARFMEKFIGQEFEGLISSVAKFGVFVLLREYNIDGLVRLEDLGGDKFEYDEENLRLVARKSGFSYSIGDLMKVQVVAADIEQGQINFAAAGYEKEDSDDFDETSAQKSAKGVLKKLHQNNFERKSANKSREFDSNKNQGRRDNFESKDKGKKGKDKFKGSKHKDRSESEPKSFSSRQDYIDHRNKNAQNNQKPQQNGKSKFFGDVRQDDPQGKAQKVAKAERTFQQGRVLDDKETSGPNEDLMKMILGPEQYRTAVERQELAKPKLSKKLMFADTSKLRDNDEYSESNSDSLKDRSANRKNSKERGKTENHRGGIRKARVSSGRGKNKSR